MAGSNDNFDTVGGSVPFEVTFTDQCSSNNIVKWTSLSIIEYEQGPDTNGQTIDFTMPEHEDDVSLAMEQPRYCGDFIYTLEYVSSSTGYGQSTFTIEADEEDLYLIHLMITPLDTSAIGTEYWDLTVTLVDPLGFVQDLTEVESIQIDYTCPASPTETTVISAISNPILSYDIATPDPVTFQLEAIRLAQNETACSYISENAHLRDEEGNINSDQSWYSIVWGYDGSKSTLTINAGFFSIYTIGTQSE